MADSPSLLGWAVFLIGGRALPAHVRILPSDQSAPFELTLAAAGAFPRASRGTVLWVGVGQGAGELVRLAERLNARLDLLGYPPEQRPFVPHLTIARSRRPQQLTAAVEALATLRIPTRVADIALIRSRLGGPESSYDSLDSFALSGTR